MSKSRTAKKEKISVASEIDSIEERKLRCKNSLERAEFRQRKEKLSNDDRQAVEDEMIILNERIQKYGVAGAQRRKQEEHDALCRSAGHQRSFLLCIYELKRHLHSYH
nr:coiled-coil domain-containing protein 167 isoform X1 [Misgurnus anguillicaudatus]